MRIALIDNENHNQKDLRLASTNLDRQVEHRLGEGQVRYTKGRRRVVTALAGADGPLSAAELADMIGEEVPVSSLYRTLTVLEESGVVVPHFSKKGVTRYELAEWLRGHHHHLVCIECGSVEDVEVTQDHEKRVRALVQEIAASASLYPVDHNLEIEGRCARCA